MLRKIVCVITSALAGGCDGGAHRDEVASQAATTSDLVYVEPAPAGATAFVDITPDNVGPYPGQPLAGIPDCAAPCLSGQNGGRVHNLAAVPGDATTYFAASEVGGLFKSIDGGASWSHVDGYVPGTSWDVDVAPGGQRVFATSFNEGRADTASVLQVSTNGGVTWSGKLPTAPPACASARAAQPSAFGIALRPGSSEVFVGTNCGVALSMDSGDSWSRFDPTPTNPPTSIWDLVALAGGRTYACGDDGLYASSSGQPGTWTSLGGPAPFPGPFCSLAVSPEEANVVFVMFAWPTSYGDVFGAGGGALYQGVVDFDANGTATGVTWLQLKNPDESIGGPKSRLPFVVTNDRSTGYDVWAGIGNLVRGTCSTPATLPAPTTSRCTAWSDTYTDKNGALPQQAHGDSGDLVFDPTKSLNACPTLYSSDGGIVKNSDAQDPSCHDPVFQGANVGLHAFMLWDMEGVTLAGADDEDLYFSTQDNGTYYAQNAGAGAPTWQHVIGGDTYDLAADATTVVASGGSEVTAGDRGFVNMDAQGTWGVIAAKPVLDIPGFIARAGAGRYFIAISAPSSYGGSAIPVGVRDVTSVKTAPLGSALGIWKSARPPCHVAVGVGPAGPQPYALAGRCFWPDSGARSAFAADELWTCDQTCQAGGDWVQVPAPLHPGGSGSADRGFGLIAVDPANPDRLYASIVKDGPPALMRSTDGGATWTFDAELSSLMSGGGTFAAYPQITDDGIYPYLQPLMVTFDPVDPNLVVAGGAASGVFFSGDGGQSWSLLSDPFTPGASGIPHFPRPMFAHFDHGKPGVVRVYLGTGRGIYRVDLANADVSVTKTATPDPVAAGADLTYAIQVTNAGPDAAQNTRLRESLPADTTLQSFTAPAGWSCTTPSVGASGPAEISCTTPAMAASTSSSFSLVVRVRSTLAAGSTITNRVRVTAAAVDPDLADNTLTHTTAVVSRTDVAITSFVAVAPPAQVIIGKPVALALRTVVTNLGPSEPVDISSSRTATAPAGSSVSPASSSDTLLGVAGAESRTTETTFTITCKVPGAQTFSFTNTIAPVDPTDVDPDLANNTATTTVTVGCVVPVAINLRPGGFPNALNLNGQATVAVLTTNAGEYGLPLAFDATKIDPLSVRFGPAAVVFAGTGGATEVHATGHLEDSRELDEKTRDHDLDMVLHFSVAESGLVAGATQACVKGSFTGPGGATFAFFGCDSAKISP